MVQAAAPSLSSIFTRVAVTAAATVAGAAAVNGAIHAGKKIYQNSQRGRYQCDEVF